MYDTVIIVRRKYLRHLPVQGGSSSEHVFG